jgi:ABC-type branched-subunit amino acid transport system substrate-binding protein
MGASIQDVHAHHDSGLGELRDATTRRQALRLLLQGTGFLGSASLLGACSNPIGGNFGITSAISPAAILPGLGTSPPKDVGMAKAALLLPLSGSIQMSLVAKGLKQAAELALFERNVPNLQLIVRDDKGTPQGASHAAMTAVADGCEIILGPLLATSVASVAPIARQAHVPVIAFSNDPANGGHGVHLLSFFASAEATRAIGHALSQGHRRFAALIPDDALGRDTEPAFRRAVAQGGGRIAFAARYPTSLSGMMDASQKMVDAVKASADSGAPIDAVFMPASGNSVGRLVTALRRSDLDTSRVKLILSSGWDNPTVLREPKLAGAWLASADPHGWHEFSARFTKTYNTAPPRLATLAYDAVSVAAAFAPQPKGQRYTAANLMREQGYAGVDGAFRLTAEGPIERSLAVLEVQPQGLVTIAPAAGFTGAITMAPEAAPHIARG